MNESKKVVIDVNELGEKMDVPKEELTFPDGMKIMAQKWGKEHFQKALSELQSCFDEPENTYLLTNIPEPWITLALLEALQPLNVLYLYPRPDGVELDMCELKRGEQTPNYDVVFEITEDGDDLFVNLNSDNPDAAPTAGPHTFDPQNLSKVMIPEIPEGKNVFVHGKGMFCVMVCVARNYIKGSKSVSLAAHDADYRCSVSFTDEREVGDMKKRTIPNNL